MLQIVSIWGLEAKINSYFIIDHGVVYLLQHLRKNHPSSNNTLILQLLSLYDEVYGHDSAEVANILTMKAKAFLSLDKEDRAIDSFTKVRWPKATFSFSAEQLPLIITTPHHHVQKWPVQWVSYHTKIMIM